MEVDTGVSSGRGGGWPLEGRDLEGISVPQLGGGLPQGPSAQSGAARGTDGYLGDEELDDGEWVRPLLT
jgi:hypothetical protein